MSLRLTSRRLPFVCCQAQATHIGSLSTHNNTFALSYLLIEVFIEFTDDYNKSPMGKKDSKINLENGLSNFIDVI